MNYETIDLKSLQPITYCRKSQDDKDKQVLSIPAQIEEMKRLTDFHNLQTIDIPIEESRSALTPNNRPLFRSMTNEIRRGKYNAVVCWKLDRLARNMVEGGEIMDMLQRGILKAIITPTRVYYPNENALLMAVEFGSANQFSRDLSVNVKRGQAKKARNGFPHGLAKIGYLNDKSEEKGNRKWMVDKEKLPLVKACFDRFLEGTHSVASVCEWAQKTLKLTTPKHKKLGGKIVASSYFYTMLKDPIYAGFFYQNGERYQLHQSIPRIITEEQHKKILKMIGGAAIRKTRTYDAAYAGFIKSSYGDTVGPDFKFQVICDCKKKFACINKTICPSCGLDIANMKSPKFLEYKYYSTIKNRKRHEEYKSIEEKSIDDYLINYFTENLSLSDSLVDWAIEHLSDIHDKEIEENKALVENKKNHIDQIDARKKRARELLMNSTLTENEYKEELANIEQEKDNLLKLGTVTDWLSHAKEILNNTRGTYLAEIIQNGESNQKKGLFAKLGSNLVWNNKNISISNKKSLQVIIDGLSLAKKKNKGFEPKNYIVNKGKSISSEILFPSLLARLRQIRNLIIKEEHPHFFMTKLPSFLTEVSNM